MEQTKELTRVNCLKCNSYLELKPVKNEADAAVMYCYHCDIYIHIVADFSQVSGVTLHLLASPAQERPILTTDKYAPVPIREIPDLNSQIPDLNAAIPDLNAAIPDLNAAIPDLNAATSEVHIEVPPLSDEASEASGSEAFELAAPFPSNTGTESALEASPPPMNSEGSESSALSEYMTLIRKCFTVVPGQTVTTAEMVAACRSRRETFSHTTLHEAIQKLQADGALRKVKRGLYELC